MKFKVKNQDLAEGLQQVNRLIPNSSSMKGVERAKLEVSDGKLLLYGTDMMHSMVYEIEDITGAEDGTMCLPADKLIGILQALKKDGGGDGEVALSETKAGMSIKHGRDRFTVRGANKATYPDFPEVSDDAPEFEIGANLFKNMIDRVKWAGDSETRFDFDCILLEAKPDKFTVVGAMMHRVAIARSLKNTGLDEEIEGPVLVRSPGIQKLSQYLSGVDGMVTVTVDPKTVRVASSKWTYLMTRKNGKFPPYDQVLPDPLSLTGTMKLAKEKYSHALDKAKLFVDENSQDIRMRIKDNTLLISAMSPEQGDAEIETDVEWDGEEVDIPFRASYWKDVVGVLEDEDIVLNFKKSELAVVEEKPDQDYEYTYLVMGVAE